MVAILRELHDDLDRAVFAAYGWDDLTPELVGKPGATTPLPDKPDAQAQAEEKLLSRLVALNAERASEEAQGNVRWLRPEFQSPDNVQTAAITTSNTKAAPSDTKTSKAKTSSAKLTWPKVLQEQIKAVRALLETAPQSADALTQQFKRNPKGVRDVVDALLALGMIEEQDGTYRIV